MFERHGVRLPRATQAAWMIGLTAPLQPLLNLMDERLRCSGYIRIDETRVQVRTATSRHQILPMNCRAQTIPRRVMVSKCCNDHTAK